nr:NADH dehydrogenase subunit 1 [Vignadula atrata]
MKSLFLWVVYMFCTILPFICVLVAVAFFTLVERKILSYIMIRKGPNKVGIMGLMQPFSDAGKLFCKEWVKPTHAAMVAFIICPGLILMTSLMFWFLFPYDYVEMKYVCGLLQFLVISAFSVYGVMLAGWASNSKYALLGAVRGVAQSISYEVPMTFILISVIISMVSLNLQEVKMKSEFFFFFFFISMMSWSIWLMCMLAETNRAPYDFVEGESELVSGFNVEYSSGGFAMIFMAEYSAMLFNSLLFVILFFGGSSVMMSVLSMVLVLFFIWVRGSLPRMRYDKLMTLCWSFLLLMSMFVCLALGFISLI